MARSNKITIRSGSGTPTAAAFVVSEPAFDPATGRFWVRGSAGMVEVGRNVEAYASTSAFPAVGRAEAVYLSTTTSRLYRWVAADGVYAEIGTVGGIADSMDGGTYA